MVGLGLGALVIRPFLNRLGNLLAFYGLIELVIGAYALSSPWLLTTLGNLVTPWLRQVLFQYGAIFYIVLFGLTFLLLIIPTLLMGATLPIICQTLKEYYTSVGHVTGRLYAINTLGAALGCLLTGVIILGIAGLTKAIVLFGIVNVAIGSTALMLSWRNKLSLNWQASMTDISREERRDRSVVVRLLLLYCLTGIITLGYEILYFRFVGTLLGNSTYVFSVILFVYLGGIMAGGLAYNRWRCFPHLPLGERFCLMHLFLGLFSFLSVVGFIWFSDLEIGRIVLGKYLQKFFFRPNLVEIAALFLPPIIFVFIPTFIMGYMFPLFNEMVNQERSLVGQSVSLVYFANIAGAGVGILLVTFILLPLLKTEGTYLLLIIGNLAFSLFYYLFRFRTTKSGRKLALVAASIVMIFAVFPSHPKLYQAYFLDNVSWAFVKEGVTGVATLKKINRPRVYIENARNKVAVLYQDGGWIRAIGNEICFRYGELLIHPAPHEILMIGLNDGTSSYRYLVDNRVHQLVCVELSDELDDAVKQLPHLVPYGELIVSIFKDPRFVYQVTDGRFWLMYHKRCFDIINTVTNPYFTSHNGNLSSLDFFELCRRRLKPGGVVVMYDYQNPIIVKTFLQIFPYVIKVRNVYLGSETPFKLNLSDMRRTLVELGVSDVQKELVSFLHGLRTRAQIEASPILKGLPVNTDIFPISEYYLTSPILNPINIQPPFNLEAVKHLLTGFSTADEKMLTCLCREQPYHPQP